MTTHIKDKSELDAILEEAGDRLVVIDFTASWCGPCKMIAPKFEELARENPSVTFVKVDIDECEDIAAEYEISSMPTFIFIKNKQKLQRFSGANVEKLQQTVKTLNPK